MVDHLHRLGPRPVGELLISLAVEHSIEAEILARLERFGRLDPATVARIEARDWPALPLHGVAA
jgi:hypothetical protein